MDRIKPTAGGVDTTTDAPDSGRHPEETKRVAQSLPVQANQAARNTKARKGSRPPEENPRGFQNLPDELKGAIDAAPDDEHREKAVVQFIEARNALEDEFGTDIHWERGAGVRYLLDTRLKGISKTDKSRYFGQHLSCPYTAAMGDANLFRTYGDDPGEYRTYGYSNAKVLAAFGKKRRLVLFNEARGDADKPTRQQLIAVVKNARSDDGMKAPQAATDRTEPVPLPEGEEIGVGPASTILSEQGHVKLDLNLPDVDEQFRKAINALLKRKADGAYYLTESTPSTENEQPAAAPDRSAGSHSPTNDDGAVPHHSL